MFQRHNPPALTRLATPRSPLAPTERPLGCRPDSTLVAVCGILLTALITPSDQAASGIAHYAAVGVALSLLASVLMDLRDGVRNLMRADLLAIASFYFLTLIEYLFPQPYLDLQISASETIEGLRVVNIALIGMLVGRHLIRPRTQPFSALLTQPLEPARLIGFFWICAGLGFLHMLLAVNFDIRAMINAMMGPRFTQPWSRSRLGDWTSLLGELFLLVQLLPPIGGMVAARMERYRLVQSLPVLGMVGFTFFYAFSSGTRNLFASYLVTFAIGYALALPEKKRMRLVPMMTTCALVMLCATWLMLKFRDDGFKTWISGDAPLAPAEKVNARTLAVDYNLISIARIAGFFPKSADYLGGEMVYMAIVRPIPRAVWPGKPVEMSVTIEEIFNTSGLTIAATYAGEAYMSGGYWGVILASVFFGAATGWWNSVASSRNSELGMLIYSSGFFAAVISMRSIYEVTTAILPTIAGLVAVRWFVQTTAAGVKRLRAFVQGPRRPGPPPRFAPPTRPAAPPPAR